MLIADGAFGLFEFIGALHKVVLDGEGFGWRFWCMFLVSAGRGELGGVLGVFEERE